MWYYILHLHLCSQELIGTHIWNRNFKSKNLSSLMCTHKSQMLSWKCCAFWCLLVIYDRINFERCRQVLYYVMHENTHPYITKQKTEHYIIRAFYSIMQTFIVYLMHNTTHIMILILVVILPCSVFTLHSANSIRTVQLSFYSLFPPVSSWYINKYIA